MSGAAESCVLVVDDESLVRMCVARALEAEGYTVVAARDGAQALEILGDAEVHIDLVLTDVNMPRLNGLELGRRIAEMNTRMPVLYLSAELPDALVTSEAGSTVAPFLLKPFSIAGLVAAVVGLLAGARAKQAPAEARLEAQTRTRSPVAAPLDLIPVERSGGAISL
jgi:DNA-binding response OmpR family regulator